MIASQEPSLFKIAKVYKIEGGTEVKKTTEAIIQIL